MQAEACAPGSFQRDVGETSCNACGPGQYQDEPGQSACKDCGASDPFMYCPAHSAKPKSVEDGYYSVSISIRQSGQLLDAALEANGAIAQDVVYSIREGLRTAQVSV